MGRPPGSKNSPTVRDVLTEAGPPMPAGSERGGMRRMNPEKEMNPQDKGLDDLNAEAMALGKAFMHDVIVFRSYPIWTHFRCQKCGKNGGTSAQTGPNGVLFDGRCTR